jgi:cell filamentation protein, protein adenylyltransferase
VGLGEHIPDEPRSSGLLPSLVDERFPRSRPHDPRAQEFLGVTHRAATLTVERLVGAVVLREVPSGGRRRMFLAEGLAAVEGR